MATVDDSATCNQLGEGIHVVHRDDIRYARPCVGDFYSVRRCNEMKDKKHDSTLRLLTAEYIITFNLSMHGYTITSHFCGQHIVAICMCHEHDCGSETERLPLRPHACGIVYLLTSNFTGRRQHLSNAVLKLFYLTGASPNICKWLCNALSVL